MLDAFEEELEDLRVSYEKYFLGVDRFAPAQPHKNVKARLRQLETLHVRATAFRFRLSGLRARMVTYEHYWTRILGQIERGTFRRDLQQRAARRAAEVAARESARHEASASARAAEAPAETPATATAPSATAAAAAPSVPTPSLLPPPPAAARKGPPPPPPPLVPGMKSTDVRRLYDDLVKAKTAAGEDTAGLTMNALARKLSRELPKLQERHGAGVQLEVATVGGKVTLRARTRT